MKSCLFHNKFHFSDEVSPQKKLRGGVIFTNAIPKNPSGKKLRKVLRERVRNMVSPKSKL